MSREAHHILPGSAEADFVQHNIRRRLRPRHKPPPEVERGMWEQGTMRYAVDQHGQVIGTIRPIPRRQRKLPPLRRSLTPPQRTRLEIPNDFTAANKSEDGELSDSTAIPTPRSSQESATQQQNNQEAPANNYRPKYRAYVRGKPLEEHEAHRYRSSKYISDIDNTDTKGLPLAASSASPVLKIPRVRPAALSSEYGASIAAAGRRAISRTGRRYRTARQILRLVEEQKQERLLRAMRKQTNSGHSFTLSRFARVPAKIDSALRVFPPATVG